MRHRDLTRSGATAGAFRHHNLNRVAASIERDEEFIASTLAESEDSCTDALAGTGAHDLPALGMYLRESEDATGLLRF